MQNPKEFDGHFVRAMYNGRERVGVTVVHHDEMFGSGDLLLLYELFDDESTMPSCRVYEKDLLADYGSVAERAKLPEDMPWVRRLSSQGDQHDFVALFRGILIGNGSLTLTGADSDLLAQLESARAQFGSNPADWSEAAIDVVKQLALNEAARARLEMQGRAQLAEMVAEQLRQNDAAAS